MKSAIRIGLAGLACLSAACAPTRVMMITSKPPGATVRVNGVEIGQTPTAVNTDTLFPRRYYDFQVGSQTALTISKEGCQGQVVPVSEWSVPPNLHVDLEAMPEKVCE